MASSWFLYGDELVVTLAPVAVYWVYSRIYELLLRRTTLLNKYRLHTARDEETKNIASRKDVVKGVLLQQAIQVAISVAVLKLTREDGGGATIQAAEEPLLVAAGRFGVAMLVLDAWQYFMHRLMHSSTYMYRRFHSWHHRVAAPYAFTAQYGHPVDGVLTETLSGAAAYLASGMSPRAAAVFFVFATVKGVEPAARGVRQQHGVPRRAPPARRRRRNFSQPFFVVWDRILGTHATPVLLRRRSLEVKVFEERLK